MMWKKRSGEVRQNCRVLAAIPPHGMHREFARIVIKESGVSAAAKRLTTLDLVRIEEDSLW